MYPIRVGVIHWDCSLPPETYFGYYQAGTLSPKKYRTFTPYYADVLAENKIAYHYRTHRDFLQNRKILERSIMIATLQNQPCMLYCFYSYVSFCWKGNSIC